MTRLTKSKELATDKTPRQARQRLADNQVVQYDVARCEARLRGTRALVLSEFDEI